MAEPVVEQILPVTGLQAGMIYHSRLEEDAYVEVLSCVIEGVSADALAQAFVRLVERHDALRTCFVRGRDGNPLQVVLRDVELPIERADGSHIDLAEALRRAQRGFDLAAAPLLRVGLLALAHERTRVVIAHHHAIVDGWSIAVLLRELLALARGATLPPAPSFASFVRWLAARPSPTTTHLVGAPMSNLAPHLGRGNPGDKTSAVVPLSHDLVEALQARARALHVGSYAITAAAWAQLLGRRLGARVVTLGVTVAGRPEELPRADEIVGPLLATVPVCVDLSRNDLVAHVQAETTRATPLGSLGLTELKQAAGIATADSWFDHVFVFENHPLAELLTRVASGSVRVTDSVAVERTGYAATVVIETGTTWRIRIDGGAGTTSVEIERLAAELHDAIAELSFGPRGVVEHPTVHAAFAPWLLHARFVEHAALTPEAIAVRDDSSVLTYRELDERSNQLAHRLRTLGAGPERIVAVCMTRRPSLVVALLGVLKSGAAYLPIDPDTPPQRIAFMAANAQVLVVVIEPVLVGRFGPLSTVVVEPSAGPVLAHERAPLPESPSTHNLAYVIYTSGSTGNPKGVMIEHGSVSSYLEWAGACYRAHEGSGAPVHSSIAFDLTVTSLWLPLSHGKTVELINDDDVVAGLARCLRSRRDYSLVKLTPLHLQLLTQQLAPRELAGLARCLVVGGEALLAPMVEPWTRFAPETRIVNEYGPTETTVGCVVHELTGEERGAVAIGAPIARTDVYVLDEELHEVTNGELYIGGVDVGRGYIAGPSLTADRFVPDPFSGEPGARLYRTGDLVRRRSDRTLDYIGRTDAQVKMRGYRIELGEIEAALSDVPGVREAAVLVVGEGDERQIVGFLRGDIGEAEVRARLAARIPSWMLPARISFVSTMPLTSNGKIDRRALLAQPRERLVGEPPRTAAERVVASIVADILQLENVGRDEDFLSLGLHSLRAMRAANQLSDTFIVDVPLTRLLAAPTVQGVVSALGELVAGGGAVVEEIAEIFEEAVRSGALD